MIGFGVPAGATGPIVVQPFYEPRGRQILAAQGDSRGCTSSAEDEGFSSVSAPHDADGT
jgi:hypothetical protein